MLSQLIIDSKVNSKTSKKRDKTDDDIYSIDPPVETPWDIFINKEALENDNILELPIYLINVGNNLVMWAKYSRQNEELNFMGPCRSKPRTKILNEWDKKGNSLLYTIQKNRITNTIREMVSGQRIKDKIISYRLSKLAIYTLFTYFDLSIEFPSIKLPDLIFLEDDGFDDLKKRKISRNALESILYYFDKNFTTMESSILLDSINKNSLLSLEEQLNVDGLKLDKYIDYFLEKIQTNKESLPEKVIFDVVNYDLNLLLVEKKELKEQILQSLKEFESFQKSYLLKPLNQHLTKKGTKIVQLVKNSLRGKRFSFKQYDKFSACQGLFVSETCIKSNLKTERLISLEERLLIWKSIFKAIQKTEEKDFVIETILDKFFFEVPDLYVFLESDFIRSIDEDFYSRYDVLISIKDRFNLLKSLKSYLNDNPICPSIQNCQGEECLLYETPQEKEVFELDGSEYL